MDDFRKELEILINRHSLENGSDTPAFILANYLVACLKAFDATLVEREKWYGREVGDWNRAKDQPESIRIAQDDTIVRPAEKEEIINLIQKHLDKLPFGIHIIENDISFENNWWEIPVYADNEPKRQWLYFDYLAGIEADVFYENKIHALLVPLEKEGRAPSVDNCGDNKG